MSVLGFFLFLWPSTLSEEEICTTGWWVAYIFAPMCVGMFGPLWVVSNVACGLCWLKLVDNIDEDSLQVVAGGLGCCCTIAYIVFIAITRFTNSEWQPAELPDLSDLECDGWCQVLFSAPLVHLGIGCACMLGAALLKCAGRRANDGPDWSDFFVVLLFGAFAWWPVVYMSFYQEGLLTMNAWVANFVIPIWAGNNGTLWTVGSFCVLLEHIRDQSINEIFGAFEPPAMAVISTCIVSVVMYVAGLHNVKSTSSSHHNMIYMVLNERVLLVVLKNYQMLLKKW